MRTAVVLGGGGVLGVAYHAGVLAALQHDLGWDARDADVIVGTSAGSLVGALVRLGAAPTDLAAIAVGGEPWDTPAALVEQLRRRPASPPLAAPAPTPGAAARWPGRLPHPALLRRWMLQPWTFDLVDAMVNMTADGQINLVRELELTDGPLDVAWPHAQLLVCAARRDDCTRVVFDDAHGAPLGLALAASCAIPGHFAPVDIDGTSYIDGGVRSTTNADVLCGRGIDLAIIVAPMAGWAPVSGAESTVRRYARLKVESELLALARAGIRSIVIQPGVEVTRRMGLAFMDEDRAMDVTREAFLDAGHQLTADRAARLLGPLAVARYARSA